MTYEGNGPAHRRNSVSSWHYLLAYAASDQYDDQFDSVRAIYGLELYSNVQIPQVLLYILSLMVNMVLLYKAKRSDI